MIDTICVGTTETNSCLVSEARRNPVRCSSECLLDYRVIGVASRYESPVYHKSIPRIFMIALNYQSLETSAHIPEDIDLFTRQQCQRARSVGTVTNIKVYILQRNVPTGHLSVNKSALPRYGSGTPSVIRSQSPFKP